MNLFLLSTPAQFINAYEAINRFSVGDRYRILYTGVRDCSGAARRLGLKYTGVRYVPGLAPWLSLLLKFWREKSRGFSAVEGLFITDSKTDLIKAVANICDRARVFLLDDGFGGIANFEQGKKGEIFSFYREKKIGRLIKDTLLKATGFSRRGIDQERITVFTAFYDQSDDYCGRFGKVVSNNYTYTRKLLEKCVCVDEVWILGSDYVEKGLVKKSAYYGWLDQVLDRGRKQGGKIRYWMHPREKGEKLLYISDRLGPGAVEKGDGCIELYTAETGVVPRTIYSCGTAAAFLLKKIHGDKIVVNNGVFDGKHLLGRYFAEVYAAQERRLAALGVYDSNFAVISKLNDG